MNRNVQIAAAVAVALTGGAAFAAGPSISTIQGTSSANTINIMGSSAIKAALTNTILANFCGGAGNATVITSNGTNTNFLGIACTPASGEATNTGNYNVWIRYEGGSVSGYLPIVNSGFPLNEINGGALTANPITVNGASTGNGVDDSFTVSAGGALHKVTPDLGIGDVEPQALIGNNYPGSYSPAAFGPANPAGLFALKASGSIIDEVYALFVNPGSAVTEVPLQLSQETITAILSHQVSNWSQVYDYKGNPVSNGALAITVVNREQGSGSRAATDILMVGDGCSSASSPETIFNKGGSTTTGATQYFATGDVLKAANSLAGSITYATIDNTPGGTGSYPNLEFVSINDIAPSNQAAAQGSYPFWVEAQYVNNSSNTGADSAAVNNIIAALQNQATTAALADVDAIPNVTSAAGGFLNTTVHFNAANSGLTPSGGGTAPVYVNVATRGGITCRAPQAQATTP